MPTVKLTISKKFDRNEKENLALELTALVAKEIGKPETVTQAIVADDAVVSFGGNFLAPSAFIVVMSVGGLNPEVCKRLSAALCALLGKYGVSGQRVTSTSRKNEEMNGAGTLTHSEIRTGGEYCHSPACSMQKTVYDRTSETVWGTFYIFYAGCFGTNIN